MNKFAKAITVFAALFMLGGTTMSAMAAVGDQGTDWAVYQGALGKFAYPNDKFVLIQQGGTIGGSIYTQSTYKTQVTSALNVGKRAHTYLWGQFGSSQSQAKAMLDKMLPNVQTPKGSIVALDYEDGASSNKQANTDAILYALKRIEQAGYTPMLYGYLTYFNSHIYLSQVSSKYQLWLGEYPDYNVTTKPNYNYFPSADNIGIFQFTSTYIYGGLDGNIDLTGITDNGYKNGSVTKPNTSTTATDNATTTKPTTIKVGTKVKVTGSKWATGQSIPSSIKGNTYTVTQVKGSNLLLSGVNSWIVSSGVSTVKETTTTSTNKATVTTYTQSGTFTPNRTLNVRNGSSTSYSKVATYYKGESVRYNQVIIKSDYVWARYTRSNGKYGYIALGVNGGTSYGTRKTTTTTASTKVYYTVKSGDTVGTIAAKYSTTTAKIKSLSSLSNVNLIYVGQTLRVK